MDKAAGQTTRIDEEQTENMKSIIDRNGVTYTTMESVQNRLQPMQDNMIDPLVQMDISLKLKRD